MNGVCVFLTQLYKLAYDFLNSYKDLLLFYSCKLAYDFLIQLQIDLRRSYPYKLASTFCYCYKMP
jgi:hypothetical protein